MIGEIRTARSQSGWYARRLGRSSTAALAAVTAVVFPAQTQAQADVVTQARMAEAADVDFYIKEYSGTGCPKDQQDSVREVVGTGDKSIMRLAYSDLSVEAEGLDSEGKPRSQIRRCRLTIGIRYNKKFRVTYRWMSISGEREFGKGARGWVNTAFQGHEDILPDPDYTTYLDVTVSQNHFFEYKLKNTDRESHECGAEVFATLDVMLDVTAGPRGEYAQVAVQDTTSSVEAPRAEFSVDVERCSA